MALSIKSGAGKWFNKNRSSGIVDSKLDVLPAQPRSRSRSDKLSRPNKTKVVEVSRKTSFDWPLGRLGKLRRKSMYGRDSKSSEGKILRHFWTNIFKSRSKQVKPWFYNLPPAGLAGVNPRGCAEKFIKAQY